MKEKQEFYVDALEENTGMATDIFGVPLLTQFQITADTCPFPRQFNGVAHDEDPWGSVETGLKRFFLPSDSDTDLFLMFVDVQDNITILK